MKNIFNKLTKATLVASVLFGAVFTVQLATSAPTYALECRDSSFLTLPTWYKGLTKNVTTTVPNTLTPTPTTAPGSTATPTPAPTKEQTDCVIVSPDEVGGLSTFIWRIVLNVIEIGMQLIAYLALFFVMYGGFQYLTSSGNPDQASKGRSTILNAIIGLVIAAGSTAVVNKFSTIAAGASTAEGVLANVFDIAYYIAGIIAVLVIIISGFKFAVGGDDPSSITKAKNSILYAVIGLIIIISAFAITNYVFGKL